MAKYYEDNYAEFINSASEKDFSDAIKHHEEETVRYYVPPAEFQFAAITSVDSENDKVSLIRLNGKEGGVVEALDYAVESKNIPAWEDTFNNGTKLAVIRRSATEAHCLPVSDNVKLSVGNRSTLSYKGSLAFTTRQVASPLAMAAVMENMITYRNKQKLQLAVIAGKVQAILTARYVPSDQRTIFKESMKELSKLPRYRFGGGYISHTNTLGFYDVASNGGDVVASVRVSDSSTGDGSISVAPRLKMKSDNGVMREVVFDNTWTQRHARFEVADFKTGLQGTVQACEDNAQKLASTMMIVINNPKTFVENSIKELNKLSKKYNTHIIGKQEKEDIKNAVDALLQFQNLSVWDYIDILWDIVPAGGSNQEAKESRERSVSKILLLDYDKLDQLKPENTK